MDLQVDIHSQLDKRAFKFPHKRMTCAKMKVKYCMEIAELFEGLTEVV